MNSNRSLFKLFFSLPTHLSVRGSKKAADKFKKISADVKLEVETDAKKLVSEVCGTNLLVEGGENVKIKPDSEYPDWLWNIYTGPSLPISKLDPNTVQYWNKIRKAGKKNEVYIRSLQKHLSVHK